MVAMVVLMVVLALVTALFAYSSYRHNYWAARGVTTAPGYLPLIGHSLKFLSTSPPRWLFVDKVYRNHSDSRLCGFYELLKPTLMVWDPELVKAVLMKDFDHFVDRRHFTVTSKRDEVISEMLTVARGNHWKGIRSVLSPSFTSGRMKGMFPLVGLKADALLDYIHREMRTKPIIPLKKSFGLYTLEVISSCAFGMETNSLVEGDSTINSMVEKLFKITPVRMVKLAFFTLFPKICSALRINLSQPEMTYFQDIVIETMKRRETGEKRGDFLDLMMEARNDQENPNSKAPKYPLKESTIVAEAMLFILAGYDTTANTLAFLAFLLAQHPLQQQRLRDELRDIIKENGSLSYQDIMEAKFLDACVSESLRLYPPAHFTERQCTKDYTIPGTNVFIPEKTIVSVPIWSLHHDPRYWSDPMVFNPDRFLPGNKDTIMSGTYLPFGLGPRNCIGMRFALMEAKLAIAKVVLEFELRCAPGLDQLTLNNQIGIMRPSDDLSLAFVSIAKE